MKGETVEEENAKKEKVMLNVNTHISDEYVMDEDLKIEIHRLINNVDSEDSYNRVYAELKDRFGVVDDNIVSYMYEEWLEKLCDRYNVERINQTKTFVELIFSDDISKRIDTQKLFMDSIDISRMFRFKTLGNKLVIVLDIIKLEDNYIKLLIKILSTLTYLD